jgi:uncharacterized protein YhjY with autotransporter beta-barrel domain
MRKSVKARLMGASLAVLSFTLAQQAWAQNNTITANFPTQNLTTGLGAQNLVYPIGGHTFVNKGLVGAGRSAASLRDFNMDTLGSFSGMALNLSSWRRNGNSYSGRLLTLPDRGYNDDFFSNYAGRISAFDLTFTPTVPAADLPQVTASQNQVTLTYNAAASFFLRDFNNVATTGEDPGANTTVQSGFTLPAVGAGLEGAGRVSLDAEALVFRRDGTFYVADEYTAGIYHFNSSGRMIGFIAPPSSILPRTGGVVNYNSLAAPTTGRRNNQGMEAAALTPDGNTLFAVLQSATVQDSTGSQETRLHTRVLVYDVSSNPTPTAPIAHYVLQLPTLDRDGTGGSADRTAAQSEILALNSTQFLLLTRDGNGVDNGDSRPIVFKSVYLVDITGATNLAGTASETTAGGTVSPGGTLAGGITLVTARELVNMLNTTQLTRFGLNIDADFPATPTTRTNGLTTLSEKWEALALAPVLEESAPQDYFLFVGNDNDLITRTGFMTGDAQYATYDAGTENDNMLLVYRLTLPTYVDPIYRLMLETTSPLTLASLGMGVDSISQENSINIASHLDSQRRLRMGGADLPGGGFNAWIGGGYSMFDADNGLSSDLKDVTLGLGYGLMPNTEIGVAVGWQGGEGDGTAFSYQHRAFKVSGYAGYAANGSFANLSYTYGDLSFKDILRPAGFGTTAVGRTKGNSHNVRAELGHLFGLNGVHVGPVGGFRWMSARLDGYTEQGAAGGNLTYSSVKFDSFTYFLGAEIMAPFNGVVPSLRVTYNGSDEDGIGGTTVRLTNAQSVTGSAAITAPDLDDDFIAAAVSLTGSLHNNMSWHAGYTANIGLGNSDDIEHRISGGFGLSF